MYTMSTDRRYNYRELRERYTRERKRESEREKYEQLRDFTDKQLLYSTVQALRLCLSPSLSLSLFLAFIDERDPYLRLYDPFRTRLRSAAEFIRRSIGIGRELPNGVSLRG